MRAVDIIMKKRVSPREELTREELEFLIGGYVRGEIPDYQVSAWLMAVCFNGMTFTETKQLTEIMLNSGETIDLTGIAGPFVDKHSTGGVGDKISLSLAPVAACLGIKVPMMSGRALGHTGGTLDKLDAITGYRTNLTVPQFRSIIGETGYAMTGQTKEIVPADRLLYALRDVTATVESVPLITASILSKKFAEGSESLVFDVKWGSGAFMKTPEEAEKLAQSLVQTTAAMGKKSCALITDMNTPLGNTVGNFLEVEEILECLDGTSSAGKGIDDIMELTCAFGSWMAIFGGKTRDFSSGVEMCRRVIESGAAMERFLKNVK
ncbi:MAG: thymidine phosphorylase, partial [Spirochaetaceae bacterium]|nr:thymidine phosphorylase [Spirochaetaceae bacterium]